MVRPPVAAYLLTLLVLVLSGCGSPVPDRDGRLEEDSFPPFSYHTIDTVGDRMGQAALADVDRDRDIDIVSKPWSTGNEHYYLRNRLNE